MYKPAARTECVCTLALLCFTFQKRELLLVCLATHLVYLTGIYRLKRERG